MSYDPTHPTVYFNIGQAVTAIGILLAFINLANPTWRLRWRLGQFRLKTAYGLFFFGIACVFIAAALPGLPFCLDGYGGWPLFWELLAGFSFAGGSLGLILSGECPLKLTERTGQNFLDLCRRVIAEGNEQELGALAKDIAASAKTVVAFAGQYDRFSAIVASESGKKYEVPASASVACNLMDLWSDRRFCNVIVTRCPDTAIDYFCAIKDRRLYNSGGRSFVQQLIAEAFRDSNSILHREERHSGLGHFPSFTETVFGDYDFVNSAFRPLQATGYEHDNLRDVEKYNQCLLRAVRAYLKGGEYQSDTSALWCGVDVLAKSGKALVERLRNEERATRLTEGPGWALTRVTEAFQEMLKSLKEFEGVLPEYPFDESDVDGRKDKSIYGILARGVYEYYDGLTRISGHDWEVRMAALYIWMDIYSPSADPECRTVLEIQKRLEVRLWAQVRRNLEEKHLCYPMITRLLVSIIGLREHPNASNGWKRVSERLRNLLKETFRRATQLDEKRARELLPEDYEYDKAKNVVIMKDLWGGEGFRFRCD